VARRLPDPDWSLPSRAEAVLARWPRRWRGALRREQVGENATFFVDAPAGRAALRLYRPGRWSDAEIETEHRFMAHLAAPLGVARPVPGRDRETLQPLRGTRVRAALVPFVPGRFRYRRPWPVHFERLGGFIARAHAATASFRPGPRKPWDRRHLLEIPRDFMRRGWSALHGRRAFPRDLDAAYVRALEEWRARRPRQGFLHADLHLGNVKFHSGRVEALDWDDCGRAPWSYDLAVPLAAELVGGAHSMRFGRGGLGRARALVTGYAREAGRPVDRDELAWMCRVRVLMLAGWVMERAEIFGEEFSAGLFARTRRRLAAIDRGFRAWEEEER